MKSLITMLVFVAISLNYCSAQDISDQEKEYEEGSMYLVTQDANGKETNRLPFGRDVFVFVNPFFKTYRIGYTNSDGNTSIITYKFVKDTGGGVYKMYYDNGKGTITYEYLTDRIESNQSLYIVSSESTENQMVLLVVNGLTRIK